MRDLASCRSLPRPPFVVTLGVPQFDMSVRSDRPCPPPVEPWLSQLALVVHAKDEQPFPPMGCADFRRCKQCCRNFIAHAAQVFGDFIKSEVKMAGDVFEENKSRFALSDDPGHVGPEVPGVSNSGATTSDGKRLARVSRRDDIHDSTPRVAVEGCDIVPHRRSIQGLVFHPRHESGRAEGFPLNVTNSSISVEGDVESEVEPSNPGT
jgi:hypothetical protein